MRRCSSRALTDVARIDAMTDKRLSTTVADDPALLHRSTSTGHRAQLNTAGQRGRHARLDHDVLKSAPREGKGYRCYISQVLQAWC